MLSKTSGCREIRVDGVGLLILARMLSLCITAPATKAATSGTLRLSVPCGETASTSVAKAAPTTAAVLFTDKCHLHILIFVLVLVIPALTWQCFQPCEALFFTLTTYLSVFAFSLKNWRSFSIILLTLTIHWYEKALKSRNL